MALNGFNLAYTVAGGILLYSGIKGAFITDTIKHVMKGNLNVSDDRPITPPDTPQPDTGSDANIAAAPIVPGGASSAQQALQNAAAAYGWGTGNQWQALQAVELREAGFNPLARNPSSGAFGMAQALGHGTANTAGTYANEYGGFGVSDEVARQANSGDPTAQSIWMCQYIKATYGTPTAAWAHEQNFNWY